MSSRWLAAGFWLHDCGALLPVLWLCLSLLVAVCCSFVRVAPLPPHNPLWARWKIREFAAAAFARHQWFGSNMPSMLQTWMMSVLWALFPPALGTMSSRWLAAGFWLHDCGALLPVLWLCLSLLVAVCCSFVRVAPLPPHNPLWARWKIREFAAAAFARHQWFGSNIYIYINVSTDMDSFPCSVCLHFIKSLDPATGIVWQCFADIYNDMVYRPSCPLVLCWNLICGIKSDKPNKNSKLHWDLDAFPRAKKGGCPLVDVSFYWFFTCFFMHFWAWVHASQLPCSYHPGPPLLGTPTSLISKMWDIVNDAWQSNGVSPWGSYRDSTLISKGRWSSVKGGDIERKSSPPKKTAFLGWWTVMNSLNLSRVFFF